MASFDPFKCGTAASFPSILSTDETDCVTSIDQIQKLAFAPKSAAALGTTPILTSTAWTEDIVGDTLVLSPFLSNVVITPGDYQEEADENNLNGMPQYVGNSYTMVEGIIKGVGAGLITKLESLTVLSSKVAGITDVKAYFLGRNSRVTATTDADGIEIFNFAIKDVGTEGRNKPNQWAFRFYLKEDWSKNAKTFDTTAPFDPLSLSNNPPS